MITLTVLTTRGNRKSYSAECDDTYYIDRENRGSYTVQCDVAHYIDRENRATLFSVWRHSLY